MSNSSKARGDEVMLKVYDKLTDSFGSKAAMEIMDHFYTETGQPHVVGFFDAAKSMLANSADPIQSLETLLLNKRTPASVIAYYARNAVFPDLGRLMAFLNQKELDYKQINALLNTNMTQIHIMRLAMKGAGGGYRAKVDA